jgi:hypothetical protein
LNAVLRRADSRLEFSPTSQENYGSN